MNDIEKDIDELYAQVNNPSFNLPEVPREQIKAHYIKHKKRIAEGRKWYKEHLSKPIQGELF